MNTLNIKFLFQVLLILIIIFLTSVATWQASMTGISLIGIYLLIGYRKDRLLQAVFVFLLIYPYFVLDYFLYDTKFAAYRAFFSEAYVVAFLNLTTYFFLGIFIGNMIRYKKSKNFKYKLTKGNEVSWILLFCITTFILIFGVSGESIISQGAYSRDHLSTLGGLKIYEYFLIFYFPLLLSATTNFLKKVSIALGILFCVKGLLIGGRIETLQFILLMGIFYRDKINKIGIVKFSIIGIGGFLIFSVYSSIRSNPLLLFTENWSDLFSIANTGVRKSVKVSHHGDVAYASMRMIGLIDIGIWDISYRIKSFFLFFSRIIIPIKFISSGAADPSTDLRDLYPTGGGGTIFTYFYVWFGTLGSIFSGILVGSIFNKFKNGISSEYFYVYASFIIITMPRWIAYTPIVIFKLALYSVIVYFIFIKFLPKLLK
jgi:hypothetical protein